MKKSILLFIILSISLFAQTYICKGHNASAIIETHGDYDIAMNINGEKYDGIWKGRSVDEKGKSIKLYAFPGNDNLWIHSQDMFKKTSVRFHSDYDNMRIIDLTCHKR